MKTIPKPLSPQQYKAVKFSKVCSYQAYLRLHEWHFKGSFKVMLETDKAHCIPSVTKSYYLNKKHRQYYSNWIESVATIYARWRGWRCEKPYDKGRKIRTEQGKEIWVKTKFSRRGEADLLLIANGKVVNIEVKVRWDRMSSAKIAEQKRAEANKEWYWLVKTLDDFWVIVDWIDGVAVDGYWTEY